VADCEEDMRANSFVIILNRTLDAKSLSTEMSDYRYTFMIICHKGLNYENYPVVSAATMRLLSFRWKVAMHVCGCTDTTVN